MNIFESATKATSSQTLSKSELQNLLTLAQSDSDRELVRYTVFKTSGLTASAARRQYGFDNMSERAARVEACIEECLHIRESINSLSEDQEAAAMQLLGINDSGTDGSSETDSSGEQDDSLLQNTPGTNHFDYNEVGPILRESQFNWFELVNTVVEKVGSDNEKSVINQLSEYFPKVLEMCHTSSEETLLQQSYQAFLNYYNTHQLEADRNADAFNGFIVTDSESEDPDQYIGLNDSSSEKAKTIIAKKRKAIWRRAQYLISKSIANLNFLKKKKVLVQKPL